MRILFINGSHRNGNTDLILSKIYKYLENLDIKTEYKELTLRDIEIKMPDGCTACADGKVCPNIKDEFSNSIEPTIRNYDIYILATPTWDDGVTPLTKIFWDRIVSWSADENKYLRGKRLAVITHEMADRKSWKNVIDWVKSICIWEECIYAGSFTLKSGSEIGDVKIPSFKIKRFMENILQ